jgi:hypothetical protein
MVTLSAVVPAVGIVVATRETKVREDHAVGKASMM